MHKTVIYNNEDMCKNVLESGAAFIADAQNIPVFFSFRPMRRERIVLYGKGHAVLESQADCAPCFTRKCSGLQYIPNISPDAVYRKVLEILHREEI